MVSAFGQPSGAVKVVPAGANVANVESLARVGRRTSGREARRSAVMVEHATGNGMSVGV
jgi:hypothetical protein